MLLLWWMLKSISHLLAWNVPQEFASSKSCDMHLWYMYVTWCITQVMWCVIWVMWCVTLVMWCATLVIAVLVFCRRRTIPRCQWRCASHSTSILLEWRGRECTRYCIQQVSAGIDCEYNVLNCHFFTIVEPQDLVIKRYHAHLLFQYIMTYINQMFVTMIIAIFVPDSFTFFSPNTTTGNNAIVVNTRVCHHPGRNFRQWDFEVEVRQRCLVDVKFNFHVFTWLFIHTFIMVGT